MTTIGTAHPGPFASAAQHGGSSTKSASDSFAHSLERDRAGSGRDSAASKRAPSSTHLAPTDSPPFMPPRPASGPAQVADGLEQGSLLPGADGTPTLGDTALLLTQTNPTGLAQGQALWARVFSQHWFANGYLSIVDRPGSGLPAGEPLTGTASTPAGAQAAATPGIAATVPEAGALDAGEPTLADLANRSAPPPLMQELASETEHLTQSLGPIIAADRSWADRLVRVTRHDDGAATLWLRDFSLTPEQVDRTVEQLRNQAVRDGLVLARIMINGRPAWTSHHPQETI